MTQKDDNGTSLVLFVFVFIGLAATIVVLAVAAFVLGALLVATVYVTGVAIITLFRPIEIDGVVLTARDGKLMLLRGFVGAMVVPLVAIVATLVTGEEIYVSHYWYFYVLGGYVFATAVMEIVLTRDDVSNQVEYLPPQPACQNVPPALPRPEPQPFRFASWNDEDGR